MKIPRHCLCLSLALSAAAAAQQPITAIDFEPGAGAGLLFTRDSDGFDMQRTTVEAVPYLRDANHFAGLRLSRSTFKQEGWRRHGTRVTLAGRHVNAIDSTGWQGEIGVQEQNEHRLLTFDGAYRHEWQPGTGIEFFASRDWIETRPALDQGRSFTFAGAALDQVLSPHFTVAAVLGHQAFSDHNARNHGRARLIYQPSLDLGLTVQARYRTYRSREDDVGGAYFNPGRYQEAMAAIGWRQNFHGWQTYLLAGLGREKIDSDSGQTTRLASIDIKSPWRGLQFFKLGAGFMHNSANWGPGYDYRYLNLEWQMIL
ncbi:MAG: hypothetical protein RR101_14185 [Burkholderiaceae bacterium]